MKGKKRECPDMPKEFFGEVLSDSAKVQEMQGRASSVVRKWTDDEIQWIKDRIDENINIESIAEKCGRTSTAIRIKFKRLKKTGNEYNDKHREAKYQMNSRMMKAIEPESVLDVFGGPKCYYREHTTVPKVVSNDYDARFAAEHDYQMDAFHLLTTLYAENPKVQFDLVDLDPYGSAYECFDLAVRMAKKGLVITLGELGHRRWRRLDFVRYAYGIESLEDFTMDRLIREIQRIGIRLDKSLVPIEAIEFNPMIGRVVFRVDPLVKTEQWTKKAEPLPTLKTGFDDWFKSD